MLPGCRILPIFTENSGKLLNLRFKILFSYCEIYERLFVFLLYHPVTIWQSPLYSGLTFLVAQDVENRSLIQDAIFAFFLEFYILLV